MADAGTHTWDGRHDTSKIDVTVVYFVPLDRRPLPDWRDRVEYFCRRITQFHHREFQDQSVLTTHIHTEPLISEKTTEELRPGDANAIWRRTLSETDRRVKFAQEPGEAFPILLVLSDINWRPLDDFYRLQPKGDGFAFEGINQRGIHFPGARSGGARAAYFADRGVGWGLVSADGWRVPYRGTDCVVYHEGCGHTVGLPHPEPQNGSVMSLAQYRGWLSESWLDKEQKVRLGWEPKDLPAADPPTSLFTEFRAIPQPAAATPDQDIRLQLTWPEGATVKSVRVRYQTSLHSPWVDVPSATPPAQAPDSVFLGIFDRATPVSYRIDVSLQDGETAELWGYLQVRNEPDQVLQPWTLSQDLVTADAGSSLRTEPLPAGGVDLLKLADPAERWTNGDWVAQDGRLLSPKKFGARIEVPFDTPDEYRVTAVVEPLDEPHGLLFGLTSGTNRFVTLFGFNRDGVNSAIENIDGENVGNESTFTSPVFQKNRVVQVTMTVRRRGVQMTVDGHTIVNWKGDPNRLSLSDYWQTPDRNALFFGAYDCRYRFYRVTLNEL